MKRFFRRAGCALTTRGDAGLFFSIRLTGTCRQLQPEGAVGYAFA